jgi:hypothetical protein
MSSSSKCFTGASTTLNKNHPISSNMSEIIQHLQIQHTSDLIASSPVEISAHNILPPINDDRSSSPTDVPSDAPASCLHSMLLSSSKRHETSSDNSLDFSLCNHWQDAVDDEEDIDINYTTDTTDAGEPGCTTLPGISYNFIPSSVKLPGAIMVWEELEEWSWQPGGWHRGEKRSQWRLGHVMPQLPAYVQVASSDHHVEGTAELGNWNNSDDDDNVHVHVERHEREEHEVIMDRPEERRNDPLCEQDQTSHIVPHIASTSAIVPVAISSRPNTTDDTPASDPDSDATCGHPTQGFCISVPKKSPTLRISWAPGLVGSTRKYYHGCSKIRKHSRAPAQPLPAQDPNQQQVVDDAVPTSRRRCRRLVQTFFVSSAISGHNIVH